MQSEVTHTMHYNSITEENRGSQGSQKNTVLREREKYSGSSVTPQSCTMWEVKKALTSFQKSPQMSSPTNKFPASLYPPV